jgi:hypothetical protein
MVLLLTTVLAVAMEVTAAVLLLSSPPSNSHLWVPINIGRFGGFVPAALGVALTLEAAALRRTDRRMVLALLVANFLAIAIGAAFLGWESRD